MKFRSVKMSSGADHSIPMFDPVVAKHFERDSSYVDTLLKEINGNLYESLFAGRRDLTFLDIGANVGLVSIYAYPSCQRIVSIEPAPATFEVLKAMTFALTKIERVQAALTPKDGPVEFHVNDENTTASSTVNTFGTKIEVPGLSLASILSIYQLEHVDVCKVDCEGAESEALNGYQLHNASSVVDKYFIETHNTPTERWQEVMARLAATLDYLGYCDQQAKGMTLIASK